MKRIVDRYVFTPGTAGNGKIVLTDFGVTTTLVQSRILLITDTTTNTIIYNFATGGGTVSGNTITLTADTSGLSSSDNLQIYYDYTDSTNDDMLYVLTRILNTLPMLNTLGYARVAIDTNSSVAAQLNSTSQGGYSYVNQPFNDMNINWSTQVRPRIGVN